MCTFSFNFRSRDLFASRVFLRPRGTFDAVLLEAMEIISRAESFVCVAAYFQRSWVCMVSAVNCTSLLRV